MDTTDQGCARCALRCMGGACNIPAQVYIDILAAGFSGDDFDASWRSHVAPKQGIDGVCLFLVSQQNQLACRLWQVRSFRGRFNTGECSMIEPKEWHVRIAHRDGMLAYFEDQ